MLLVSHIHFSHHNHADRLRKNCQNFQLEVVTDYEVHGAEDNSGLLKAIMNELFTLSATVPGVRQRCIELNIPVDRGLLQSAVLSLRYGFTL